MLRGVRLGSALLTAAHTGYGAMQLTARREV